MGKLKAFYIELENPQGVYFEGQLLNGKLIVELDAEMKMRGKNLFNSLVVGCNICLPFSLILKAFSSRKKIWGGGFNLETTIMLKIEFKIEYF